MAQIPLGTQFIGLASTYQTVERRSALINNESQPYTMQDIIDTVGGGLEGTQYVFVAADGTDVENAAELQAAYVTAQGMSPSATNRITVIAAPGNYNFSTDFVMNTQYIDLVSLDGNRSIVFNGSATLSITANDVFVKGVDVLTKNFKIASSLNLLKVENCKGGNQSFGGQGSTTVSGTFTNCIGGSSSFGGDFGIASGVFTNCTGAQFSFGGNAGIASGVFTNCTGGLGAFGGDPLGNTGGLANGTFNNCTGGDDSFGGTAEASGIFTDCTGGDTSFGSYGTASGTFTSCTGGYASFGAFSLASGTFTSCSGGEASFGGDGGEASGTFTSCLGGDISFGSYGIASGTFTNCIGGSGSFGGFGLGLDGKLYYCRLTSGSFETVTSPGITRLCIDGNNVENNQG
jgi:hypothetical protein